MDWLDQDATALSGAMARGALSAERLMSATLERIERENPSLTAIVSMRASDALLQEARVADRSARKGWLHGIPMAVKDLADVAGVRSTQGSPIFADHLSTKDSGLATRLKVAGAILIGKTNVPEFGLGSHSMNPVFGTTKNPYDTSLSAGGSSGGAAAALAARMVAVADGSDMMGSLRNPAGWCNVYSLRPTWGLVPADPGGDTFLHPLSTNGPMARSPRDLMGLLETLATPEPRVPFARSLPETPQADVAGWRIGWLGDWGGAYPTEAGVLDTCTAALAAFETLGCVVEAVPPPFPAADLWESWTVLRAFAIAGKLRGLHSDVAQRALLKPELIWEIERGLALTAMEVQAASEIRSAWFAAAATLFARYDALVLPSAQTWPFPAEWRYPREIAGQSMDTYHRWMEIVVPVSLIGLPCLGLPAGFGAAGGPGQGLPIGLQVFGPAGTDGALLHLAQAYDDLTGWPARHPPRAAQA